MLEKVKVYNDSLNVGYYGDLVRCVDCETLMLIPCGMERCLECNSENLMWYDEDKPEWTVTELEEAGFVIEDEF